MANSEDYLDGLLDSITQAREETRTVTEERPAPRGRRSGDRKSRIRPGDDFMEANGLSSYRDTDRRSRRSLRRSTENDFVRSFEDELSMDDADDLIRAFERELRSSDDDEFYAGDADSSLDEATSEDDDFFASLLTTEEEEEKSPSESILADIDNIVSEAKRVASGADDDIPIPAPEKEEPAADLDIPDMPDIPEEPLSEDTSAQEVPLMDESGEGVDLMDVLAGEGEEDLADIESLLNADEEGEQLSEAADEFEAAAESVSEGGEGLEASETGASGEAAEGTEGEEGEEAPKQNPIQKLLGAITGMFKKKEGDEEDEEDDEEEEEAAEEGGETKEEKKARIKKEKEEAKKKKKEEADAKKKQKEEEKKKKAEEKKKAQAAKAAKPKKQKPKKPKERSPKVPIPVIVVFLLFSLSIIASTRIMSGVLSHRAMMSRATDAYDKQDYTIAYQALMGEKDLEKDEKKLRNRAKLMAYMQTKRNEYLVCMESGRTSEESGIDNYNIRSAYQMALDSLVAGVYFYQQNEEKANELGISEEYAEYGQSLEKELDKTFNITAGEAVELYHNSTRKEYTAALQRIIRDAGFEEKY